MRRKTKNERYLMKLLNLGHVTKFELSRENVLPYPLETIYSSFLNQRYIKGRFCVCRTNCGLIIKEMTGEELYCFDAYVVYWGKNNGSIQKHKESL